MSSMNSDSGTSPLYRYAVLAAVFLFASVFATVYVRSRLEQRRRELARGFGDFGFEFEFDPRMKPPLFDAYLPAAAQVPRPIPRAEAPREWDEIMPLSISHGPQNSSPAGKDAAPSEPEPAPSRLFVSVIVSMPLPPQPIRAAPDDEEAPLPYLEIGLAEVDVLHTGSRGGTKSVL
ncbi:hypothetical protein B0H17DRAFT_1028536 [Mycena rosella]|uniref:Uncharacterized protein n=1 Tax=Mycena rosella TaxID=1033263 RepID=A0AAD7H190_MYCRO|nr:hypothetical protein B0H17DRAFT_1028536 [Mycena rosella]